MRFVGWKGGGCSGAYPCTVSLAAATSVTALFGPARVAAHLSVTGKGRIACSPRCRATVAAGAPLVLTAVPAKGWRFVGWSGSCRGSRLACRLTPAAPVSAHARFAKKPVTKKR
jgi:hypothetical protein